MGCGEGEHWAQVSGDRKIYQESSHAQPPSSQASQTGEWAEHPSRPSSWNWWAPTFCHQALFSRASSTYRGTLVPPLPQATCLFFTALSPHSDLVLHPLFPLTAPHFTVSLLCINCFKYFYASFCSPQYDWISWGQIQVLLCFLPHRA